MDNFLSHPGISGFITASSILIATSQVKHCLGIKADGDTLPHLRGGIGGINFYTLVIGVAATAFLFWPRKQLKPLLLARGLRPRPAPGLGRGRVPPVRGQGPRDGRPQTL
jgi:SulP family sulfate permease